MSGWLGSAAFAAYVVAAAVFIVLENRRPQATFAWIFLFILAPLVGPVVYFVFGRDHKAFARKPGKIRLDQNDGASAGPLTELLKAQETTLRELVRQPGPQGRLAQLVHHNSSSALTKENRVEILQDAGSAYPKLLDDIRAAKNSIHLQFFVWAADAVGYELQRLLLEKAAEGVEVRLLYDPMGSLFRMGPRYRWPLTAGGVKVAPYARLWRLHTISYRNHRKIAIIDNTVGYTGGLNIGQEHVDGGGSFRAWRDTHLRIVGTAAVVLQAAFAVDWFNATGEELADQKYFPPVPEDTSEEDIPVQITVSGPDSRWRAIRQLYFALINSAREHVYIQSPFFILDPTISEAIKAAALSGVDVRIMLGDVGYGNQLPYWAGYTYMEEVARAGAKIFLYRRDRYFHPKTISIDSKICSIGSANMDIRSFSINYELNAVIYDETVTRELEEAFSRDCKDCEAFSLERYRATARWRRLRDSVARLASPLL